MANRGDTLPIILDYTINDKFDVEVYKLTLPTGKSLFT